MADVLPLQHMVLYKHGVGFFTRQGVAGSREVELPFRATEIDDALKSLIVLTLDGGQVIGVHYQTPENREERLAEIPFALGDRHTLFDLFRASRGTGVSLELHRGETRQGRVMGVEVRPQGNKNTATLVLLTGSSSVEQIPTEEIRSIQFDDERLAQDLESYLETIRSDEARRPVHVDLSEPGHRIQVSYIAPSPVWRVSYRLIGSDNQVEHKPDRRSCLLQGWGIFDNRLDEDLEDVEVMLVAGQPVSFRYDLTSSVIPERHLVHDEARIAAGPIEFEGAVMAAAPAAPAYQMEVAATPAFAHRMARSATPMDADILQASTQSTVEGRDLDELFEYRLGGVSVKRGESAMVPVVQHTGNYRRELLYNSSKQPRHPVVTLRLRNETGLTLERGPVTVVEDGQYRGEAILPFTRIGAEIVLAFAVELGVTITETGSTSRVMVGLDFRGSYLHVQEHMIRKVIYTLLNRTSDEHVVTIEQARWGEAELTDTRAPDETTGEHRRWRVSCAPNAETAFEVTDRLLLERSETILDQSLSTLSDYLNARFLDSDTRRALEAILRLRQSLQDIDQQVSTLRAEQQELGNRQDRLRQNLTIQAGSEQEQEIRRRSADEFRRTQDREDEIGRELARLAQERQNTEDKLREEVARLGQ